MQTRTYRKYGALLLLGLFTLFLFESFSASVAYAQSTNLHWDYGYNKRDEMTDVNRNTQDWQEYDYDPNGSRTMESGPDDSVTTQNFFMETHSDRLQKREYPDGSSVTFAYDPEGNMIRKELYAAGSTTPAKITEYAYNYQGTLTEVKINDETVAQYAYDTNRQRIYARVNEDETIYHWDHAGRIIGEGTRTQNFTVKYFYSGNQKVAMARVDAQGGEQMYFFVNNAQGTPMLIMDNTGQIVQRMLLDAYGNVEQSVGIFADEINFTGKKYDAVTGLYYFNQRYYDPDLGRFITEDPAEQYLNPYLYGENNPLMYVDPSGEFVFTTFLATIITGALKGAITGALMNGAIMALQGGNFIEGMLEGAKNGALFGASLAGGGYFLENTMNFLEGYGFLDNDEVIRGLQLEARGYETIVGDSIKASESYQEAIDFVERKYGINTNVSYKSILPNKADGVTNPQTGEVFISSEAMKSPSHLKFTLFHESIHVKQSYSIPSFIKTDPKILNMYGETIRRSIEQEAYIGTLNRSGILNLRISQEVVFEKIERLERYGGHW